LGRYTLSMGACALLAAMAAVLGGGEVVFVDTVAGRVVSRVALGAEGAAVFAAPDGRVVVPMADTDATLVIPREGAAERWAGRVFPLFFDQSDRMHVVSTGRVTTLSYPERLPLARIEVAFLAGARRAAVSSDGRLVVVIPVGGPASSLVVVATGPTGGVSRVELPADARAIAVAADGNWFVAGLADGRVALVLPGTSIPLVEVDLQVLVDGL